MKKFLRRLNRPLPCVALVAITLAALLIKRDYYFPLVIVLGSHLLVEAVDFFFESQIKRRKGPEAVKDNLIEVYVDDFVFFSVSRMADMAGVSVPVFCYCVLQSLDMDDFIAIRQQMDKED